MTEDRAAEDRAAEDRVAVGRIGPARGLAGDLFVEPWTDAPEERFAPGAVLSTDPDDRGPLTVETAGVHSGKQVVRFAGVDDRSAAEGLRGTVLFVAAGDRAPIADPDEFYDTDLVGLRAVTVSGAELGPVRDVLHAGAAAYLVVRPQDRDQLVPFVAAVVPVVDIPGGTVTIDPPDGLFDL